MLSRCWACTARKFLDHLPVIIAAIIAIVEVARRRTDDRDDFTDETYRNE